MIKIELKNGKILEFCAEAGTYTFDSGTEPSIFTGGLGKGIIDTINDTSRKTMQGQVTMFDLGGTSEENKEMQELKPDVIIADSMAFWGKLIAQKLNIPFISSTTTFAFNKYSARVMKQEGPGLFQLIKSIPKINKSLNRLREKGYEVKSMLDIIANDENTSTIVYTSKYFQPYSETFNDNFAFVGPVLREGIEKIEKVIKYHSDWEID